MLKLKCILILKSASLMIKYLCPGLSKLEGLFCVFNIHNVLYKYQSCFVVMKIIDQEDEISFKSNKYFFPA